MHEAKLRGVDLNLLTVLAALLRHESVTRAAAELGMSQPAASRALGRLRALLGDRLLARGPAGALVATPRARALLPRLDALLAEVAGLVAPEAFDPARIEAVMRVAATDHQTLLLLPRLMPLLRPAPGLALRVLPITGDTPEALAAGRLDLAFSIAGSDLPANLRQMALYRDRFVTVLRRGHPALEDWTLERFCALDHILVSVTGSGIGAMDEALRAVGRARRIALWLPHFHAALRMVAETDLVVTLPRSLARDEARPAGLETREPPLPGPDFTTTVIWPEALDDAPAHRWLRARVAEAARAVPHAIRL